MYDAKRVERIRGDTAGESDDRSARYLIEEIEKACVRDPDAESLGTRYDSPSEAADPKGGVSPAWSGTAISTSPSPLKKTETAAGPAIRALSLAAGRLSS